MRLSNEINLREMRVSASRMRLLLRTVCVRVLMKKKTIIFYKAWREQKETADFFSWS